MRPYVINAVSIALIARSVIAGVRAYRFGSRMTRIVCRQAPSRSHVDSERFIRSIFFGLLLVCILDKMVEEPTPRNAFNFADGFWCGSGRCGDEGTRCVTFIFSDR